MAVVFRKKYSHRIMPLVNKNIVPSLAVFKSRLKIYLFKPNMEYHIDLN